MRPRAQQPARSRTAAPPVRRMPAAGSTHEALVKPSGRSAEPAIVVGYDGTPLGRTAVAEAGRRAGRTGTVFVVYAYPMPPGFLGSPYFGRRLSAARGTGARALSQLLSGEGALPEAEYVAELIAGRPAAAITRVAAARKANEIVVGARRTRSITARFSSSTSRKLLRTAEVPVITVRPPVQPSNRRPGEPGRSESRSDRESALPDVSQWW